MKNTKTTGKVKEKSGKNQSFFFLENIQQIQKILEKSRKNQGFSFLENILQIQQKLEKSGSLSLEHFSKVGTMYLVYKIRLRYVYFMFVPKCKSK